MTSHGSSSPPELYFASKVQTVPTFLVTAAIACVWAAATRLCCFSPSNAQNNSLRVQLVTALASVSECIEWWQPVITYAVPTFLVWAGSGSLPALFHTYWQGYDVDGRWYKPESAASSAPRTTLPEAHRGSESDTRTMFKNENKVTAQYEHQHGESSTEQMISGGDKGWKFLILVAFLLFVSKQLQSFLVRLLQAIEERIQEDSSTKASAQLHGTTDDHVNGNNDDASAAALKKPGEPGTKNADASRALDLDVRFMKSYTRLMSSEAYSIGRRLAIFLVMWREPDAFVNIAFPSVLLDNLLTGWLLESYVYPCILPDTSTSGGASIALTDLLTELLDWLLFCPHLVKVLQFTCYLWLRKADVISGILALSWSWQLIRSFYDLTYDKRLFGRFRDFVLC
ncbi:unnamed protein product [Amoebophrya sp. A25]|nr:unnamed protein product [Amoebophrya sp. A25]|eukprot:GSA25T00009477001.1